MACLLTPRAATAHGIWGHVHVTGWAIENLADGPLKAFFADPDVRNAALFGAAFTDSGYAPRGGTDYATRARAYSEHTHWEPFIRDFVAWIRANDPPPWTSLESRQRVAFLMGCAAHGLQDEIFDSLFLDQVHEHDGGGQDEADPGTDGFLALGGHIRLIPQQWMPLDTLVDLYETLDAGVTSEDVRRAVQALTFAYVNATNGPRVAEDLGRQYEDVIPWTRDHYMDHDIPGSLLAEVAPTGAYLAALWQRLHEGHLPGGAAVTHIYPATPFRLRGADPGSVDSWVTLIFGVGVRPRSASIAWVSRSEGAEPVPFTLRSTRWGSLGDWSRLIRVLPGAALTPGGGYRVSIEACA